MTESSDPVTLDSLKHELAGMYAGLAVFVNECYLQGAGNRMLGGAAESHPGVLVDAVDVDATSIGRMLPLWFRYGYEGIVSAGYDVASIEDDEGPFEQLRNMLNILRVDNPHFDWCLAGAGVHRNMFAKSHLADMLKHVEARNGLDSGTKLGLDEVALLANMNERSVRNATSAEGESRLALLDDGLVAVEEARRWLKGRRGFVPTQFRELPGALEAVPDSLDDVEIPVFVFRRLRALASRPTLANAAKHRRYGDDDWLVRASQVSGLSAERVKAVAQLPMSIRPNECAGLAKALKVDAVWFTYQVMTALFPQQVDMLLNPGAWSGAPSVGAGEPQANSVTVTLTGPMLQHGYLDLPSSTKDLFPADCFSDRAAESTPEQSNLVELVYGAHREKTDIRVKSAKTISPRRRFVGWFNTELGAKPGDRIKLEKTAERVYTLTHITNA
ncbi:MULTISPECIES: hypothetical protein [unclassified Variovorax]|uniref:hypothetical protein n=1 Tax=unclassified Variovorax TaxID=663243 RepID=UPI00076C6DEF|nr:MULTISPECIES: hypothetical protein [unclassified Variovorax]KWT98505.1 hypothetical protein APY03_0640 [Variovorax sp. WDL1]PNG49818.1 hypothetical protein CHC06_05399 [Variovorax sp. B2]PNG50690.1 hypothetical protein CHC07_05304 [Variovorax sp. B4]VTV17883.1 hypothetical protein WDL1P1_00737 [Variovorax sp. WDL1]